MAFLGTGRAVGADTVGAALGMAFCAEDTVTCWFAC